MAVTRAKEGSLAKAEDKVFRPLLKAENISYVEFCEIYNKHNTEFRENLDELQKVSITYTPFKEWFTRRGLKLRRVIGLLSLLRYRLVIVPYYSTVSVTYNTPDGIKTVGSGAPSKDNDIVQLFTLNKTTNEVKMEEIFTGDEVTVLRKTRGSPESNVPLGFVAYNQKKRQGANDISTRE